MSDAELDRLLESIEPIDAAELDSAALAAAERELLEELLATPPADERPAHPRTRRGPAPARPTPARRPGHPPARTSPAASARAPRRSFGRARALGGSLSALLAIGLLALVLVLATGDPSSQPQFAAAAVRVAQTNERLLVDAPGWRVVSADQFTVDEGEMTFSDGRNQLELFWRPARTYDALLADRALHATRTEVTVLGRAGIRFFNPDVASAPSLLVTVLPPENGHFIELRGDFGSVDAYMRVLRSLRSVDVDSWLAALPADVVTPAGRHGAVDALLRDVPLPPAFDRDRLRGEPGALSGYQLRYRVASAVACGWLMRWDDALAVGDDAAARAAVEAMRGAHDWPLLVAGGQAAFASVTWQVFDAIAARPAHRPQLDAATLAGYRQMLACDR